MKLCGLIQNKWHNYLTGITKSIRKHINNAIKEEVKDEVVVAKFENTTEHGAIQGKTQTHMVEYYNLDMIISVGYRFKSDIIQTW